MNLSILMTLSLLSILSQTRQLSLEKQAIADTQRTLASELDTGLPDISFADWHEKVLGRKAGVVWQLSECGEQVDASVNGTGDARACVEVNTLLADGRKVVIMIAVGTFKKGITGRPAFQFGVIERNGELRPIRRLGDLKNILSTPWELAKPPVALPELNLPSVEFAANNVYLPVAASGNGEVIGWPTEIEEPPPPPPDLPQSSPPSPKSSPPSPNQPQSIQEVVEQVLEGNAITRVAPVYPPQARMMRAMGTVKVQVTISETGKVIDAKAISGHQALRPAAVDAAYKWTFKPTTTSDGTPIKVQGVLNFNFRSSP